jgi:hypothetical protein
VTNTGTGYQTPPIISIGGPATATTTLQTTGIARVVVNTGGSQYTVSPTVYTINGPLQTTAPTSPLLAAQLGFDVSNIVVTYSGTGYSSTPSVTIAPPTISGGNTATATATIGNGSGLFYLTPYPSSNDYFAAWKGGTLSNNQLSRPYIERMNTIIAYFTNLGYNITRQTNYQTGNTIQWYLQW